MPGIAGPDALHTAGISVTRRGDGGYALAISGAARVDPTPQQIVHARHFLPMFAKRWRILRPGGTQAWRAGHETRRRWRLDAPTPMERMRVLDPVPDARALRRIRARADALIPAMAGARVQASWAGYIDSTRTASPPSARPPCRAWCWPRASAGTASASGRAPER
ncbi:hypothetical protein FLP41_02050 (plasmid) [Paracoccus marcusii]|uniref:hypothetical protein n=1 Tax=Paracoccus marcusii TaxID=59779 RepID=UPI002ED59984|nr:hypothetical protein FLP41_02050 [Paracoccus marcusii]